VQDVGLTAVTCLICFSYGIHSLTLRHHKYPCQDCFSHSHIGFDAQTLKTYTEAFGLQFTCMLCACCILNRIDCNVVGRDSSVGIAARYVLDGPVVESRWVAKFISPVQTGPWAHPASYIMGTGPFPGVKRPGSGVDHPYPLVPRLRKE
jgi:hypothetical protein